MLKTTIEEYWYDEQGRVTKKIVTITEETPDSYCLSYPITIPNSPTIPLNPIWYVGTTLTEGRVIPV